MKGSSVSIKLFWLPFFLLPIAEVNHPINTKPTNTTQKIVCHKALCGNASGKTPISGCASTITTSLIPTQPTIANAAPSSPGYLFNNSTNRCCKSHQDDTYHSTEEHNNKLT